MKEAGLIDREREHFELVDHEHVVQEV